MSAPDRILAWTVNDWGSAWSVAPEDAAPDAVEYVRADIAADLLAALEACAGFADCNGMVNGVNVSAAIARARGAS